VKIRILGCGTSFGVPRIGNDWGECDPAEPRNSRTRSSILLESGGKRLLVDCGPDLRQQLLEAGVGDLDAVIITHDHADHCHGIDDLRAIAQRRDAPVPILARADVLQALTERFPYIFRSSSLYRAIAEPVEIGPDLAFGNAKIRFTDQPHGNIVSLGLRMDEGDRSVVYAIDFNELTEDMRSLYQGADMWICDCLSRRPHPTHTNLDAVVEWARELGMGRLYLSHMNNSMDYATLVKELPDWAAPAHDGLEIELT
jgi:phosphoribosyl 1,2-cyclic phosphate phosphodiesterase